MRSPRRGVRSSQDSAGQSLARFPQDLPVAPALGLDSSPERPLARSKLPGDCPHRDETAREAFQQSRADTLRGRRRCAEVGEALAQLGLECGPEAARST
jgi:hypothetical protein